MVQQHNVVQSYKSARQNQCQVFMVTFFGNKYYAAYDMLK